MVSYKTIAIVGATGGVGTFIVEELLAVKSYHLKVLTQKTSNQEKDSKLSGWKKAGVVVEVVDFESPESLLAALKGQDVVISALNREGLAVQTKIIKPAKEAGVQLFIPSEFGVDTSGIKKYSALFGYKTATIEALKAEKLPYIQILTSLFTDTTFVPYLGFDIENGRAELYGNKNVRISFTHRRDIGRAIVGLLRNPNKYVNQAVSIHSETLTYGQIIEILEKKHNKKFSVTYKSLESLANELDQSSNLGAVFAKVLEHVIGVGEAEIKAPSFLQEFGVIKPITLASA